jgi:hypothetical protein
MRTLLIPLALVVMLASSIGVAQTIGDDKAKCKNNCGKDFDACQKRAEISKKDRDTCGDLAVKCKNICEKVGTDEPAGPVKKVP